MSEQEQKSGGQGTGMSPMVMMEQSTESRHKQPYRPNDLQDEPPPDLHHKRSRAPAVPSVAEELKDSADIDIKERRESERAMSSEDYKHNVAKKLSSVTKRRELSPEAMPLKPLEVETKLGGALTPTSQPIPPQVSSAASVASELTEKTKEEKKGDDDSITEEIEELRTHDPATKASDWFDDEEAGGLPRSDSRGTRVSRVVRQLFCCGVPYDAPSEDEISTLRGGFSGGV